MTRRVRLPVAAASPALPRLQGRWVAAILDGEQVPAEPNATCDDCAMLPEPGAARSGTWFNPATRCCTYLPELANFLVGGALAGGGDGAATTRARLAAGDGLSPLGLAQHDAFRAAYEGSPEAFGRAEALVCPHFADGRCTVWAHREATCATWFCKHARGAVHKGFWNRLHQAMQRMERAVALHCALALGVPAEGLARLLPLVGPDGRPRSHDVFPRDGDDPAEFWGPWAGREEDFFRACAEVAEGLDGDEVLAAGGAELQALAPVLRRALAATRDATLPPAVAVGAFQVLGLAPTAVKVQGYSHLDPLAVPRALFDVLHHFDGRPTDDALAAATAEAGETVPPAAIRLLLDFGILRGG
jgi:hypothetical protein